MAAFLDVASIDALCDLADERDHDAGEYLWSLVEQATGRYVVGNDWFDIAVDPANGLNVAIFTSGYDDGSYASYW